MLPSIVLLPGMDGTGDLFQPLLDALDGSLSAVVVRYPPTDPLGYEDLTSLARQALPTDRPYVLLGESFSGPIVVTLAAERPPGLVALILCASFVSNPMPLLRLISPFLELLPIEVALKLLGPNRRFGRYETPELRKLLFAAAQRVSTPVLHTRMRAALDVDVSASLGSVHVPVTYIRATEDALLTEAAARRVLRSAPTAKVVEIAAPHGVLQCVPREAARIIVELARSVSPL